MKKIYIVITAVVALLAVSCQAFIEDPVQEVTENEVVDTRVPMSFTASAIETKTNIGALSAGEYPVTWSSGDQIKIVSVDGEGASLDTQTFDINPEDAGKTTATFSGSITEGATYYAVYPAVAFTVDASGNISITNNLNGGSSVQTAVAGGYDKDCAMLYAKTTGTDFEFKHGVAYFKITVGTDNVSKVTLYTHKSGEAYTNTGATRFYGRPVYQTSSYLSYATSINGASNNISLAPTSGTLTKGATYYIPVLVKNTNLGALTVLYTFSNSTTAYKTNVSHASSKLAMGKVYDLGTLDISAEPVIAASDVNIDHDDTGGTINFTVSNLVDGGYVVKDVTSDGLDNSSWSDVSFNTTTGEGSITFTCDENTDPDYDKTATVHLFYTTDGISELDAIDVTVTQSKTSGPSPHTYVLYRTGSTTNAQVCIGEVSCSYFYDITGSAANFGSGGITSPVNIDFDPTTGAATSYSYSYGFKFDSSGGFKFTTSSTFDTTIEIYAAGKDATTANNAITIDGNDYTFPNGSLTNSGEVSLLKNTEYTIKRKNKEIEVILVIVRES